MKRFADVMKISCDYDRVLFVTFLTLLGIGAVMIYNSSAIYADYRFGNSMLFIRNHLVYLMIGAVVFTIVSQIRYETYARFAPMILLACLGLVVLTMVPLISIKSGGARRWLNFGFVTFQPAECLKLSLVMYVSYLLSKKDEQKLRSFMRGVLPILLVSFISMSILLLQPDFGSVLTIFFLIMIMLLAGGARVLHILAVIFSIIPVGVMLVVASPYRMKRILSFLNPWDDALDSGFQIIQSFIGFYNGGIFGRGIGMSKQKLLFLPDAHTDFIFSVIGEEVGFIGGVFVVLLFGLFIYKGISIAKKTTNEFGSLLAFGITMMIGIQAAMNFCVVTGLVPTKGLPLPFISYGGTSLIVNMAAVGILFNIARRGNQA